MSAHSLITLFGFIAACFITALIGSIFRPGDWYERLAKPSWRPPNRLFAPVWTVLYFIIAVSGWLIWSKAGFVGAALPLVVYSIQLILNAAWSPIFFGLHRPDLGFIDIVLLWLTIAITIVLFHPIHATAALLLVPYLAWVTFAAALNFTIWRLNPEPLVDNSVPLGSSRFAAQFDHPIPKIAFQEIVEAGRISKEQGVPTRNQLESMRP